MSRNRQVFGLGISLPRRLPGIISSGILPVRYPTPLRASPGSHRVPWHPSVPGGKSDAVGSALNGNREAGQNLPERRRPPIYLEGK